MRCTAACGQGDRRGTRPIAPVTTPPDRSVPERWSNPMEARSIMRCSTRARATLQSVMPSRVTTSDAPTPPAARSGHALAEELGNLLLRRFAFRSRQNQIPELLWDGRYRYAVDFQEQQPGVRTRSL